MAHKVKEGEEEANFIFGGSQWILITPRARK